MGRYIPEWGYVDEQLKPTLTREGEILDDPELIYNTGEGNTLCYHPHRNIWFYSSPYAVLGGEYNINRKLQGECYVAEGDLYRMWKLPEKFWDMDECGWSQYKGSLEYGYIWIDFIHTAGMTQSGKPVLIIEEVILPHPDYFEWEDT